jgi:2-polyprenyl-3-methyl-5-hydroxy-6-metoxy-1,4-benzoquinol methylase
MMDVAERMAVHSRGIKDGHVPYPEVHLTSPRDRFHFDWTLKTLKETGSLTTLDIGVFDGWLDFLLSGCGFYPTGIELVPALAEAANRYAQAINVKYTCHCGFFDKIDLHGQRFDAVMAYEVLEHIPLDDVPAYVARMEQHARNAVMISLPDQSHLVNDQHLWTATEELIFKMWSSKPNFEILKVDFGMGIPDDWFIKWAVK